MSQLTICLLIFVVTVIFFCTGKLSLATVAITSMMVLNLTGCLDAKTTLSYFGNSTVLMIGGMCVVAAGFNRTQFCSSLADKIASASKGSLNKMMLGYVVIGVLLSQFIQSPLVAFGIVAPMLIASAESMGYSPSKVVFPVGISTIITCCTLPVGAGATVASELNGYLESYGYTEYTVGMADAMIARLPLMIITILYCSFVASKIAPDQPVVKLVEAKATTAKEPLPSFQEWAGILIFFGDALALMFASNLGLATWQISVIGAVLMVLFGVLKPNEAAKALPVSMLLMTAGALGIAGALSATGAGELVGGYISNVIAAVGGNSYIVGLIFFIVPFILTQFMSNRGTMLIFWPIAIATCSSMNANPVGLMILIQAACLASFLTPMATAAVPYVMDYGGYDQRSMFKQGLPLAAICCVVSVLWIMTVFPL